MNFPAAPERLMYHGVERVYVPATRHTVFPGCAFAVAPSRLNALAGELPLAVHDPLGDAYSVHAVLVCAGATLETVTETEFAGDALPAASYARAVIECVPF